LEAKPKLISKKVTTGKMAERDLAVKKGNGHLQHS